MGVRQSSNIPFFAKLDWCGTLCSGKCSSAYIKSAKEAVDSRKTLPSSQCHSFHHYEGQGEPMSIKCTLYAAILLK